jgi:cytochrome P450
MPFDIVEESNQLALEIIAKTLFDVDWSDRAARLRDAVHVFRTEMQKEISRPVVLPDWLPLPGRLRQRRAVREVDRLIWELIRERRSAGGGHGDMLSVMLSATRGGADGAPVPERVIRDEATMLFIAGHDTTSAALAWFWYLLAQHPEVETRVLREVDDVLGGRLATAADVPRLRYLELAARESLRLYPPSAFLYTREAVEDVELGGYTVPRGSWVIISPYVVQHDPRNFKDPEVFDPERFAPGRADAIPPYAFLPFGGGPRVCTGSAFALAEMAVVAATVLQRFRLVLEPGQPAVEPRLEIVLRPRGSVFMRAVPREQPVRTAGWTPVPAGQGERPASAGW